ncbi:MAG: serine/threonine protein kinase [Planctomycetes bacterium]|nr:serine/threonine protein kinase [Planctomycetota bacterium]
MSQSPQADPDELRYLARLVHRGYLTVPQGKELVSKVQGGYPLDALMVEGLGWEPAKVSWLRETNAGERPRIPGFQVGARLGQGGSAEVFRAKSEADGRTLALKILNQAGRRNPDMLRAFVEEGKRLAQLSHPGLVAGFGVAKYADQVFTKLEWIEGETLQERLDRGEFVPEVQALKILLQVSSALQYLAEQGLVHRDVKPGNIMLTKGGQAKLIDLGFCAAKDSACREGLAVGTVEYLSPEQAMGGATADVRSDIYSLGVTLFQMTVGRLPFESKPGEDVLRQHVLEVFRSSELKGRALSPQLQYFIEKMLAKDAGVRFQSYGELISEVQGQIEGQRRLDYTADKSRRGPLRAQPRSSGRRTPRRRR